MMRIAVSSTAIVYLVAALLLGIILAARPALNLPAAFAALTPVYFHLLMVGWVTQLIVGVVYWMFPRYSPAQPRGSDRLALATYLLLNAGLILRAVGEPMQSIQPDAGWGGLLVVSALLQLLAGWAFVVNTWPRVRQRA